MNNPLKNDPVADPAIRWPMDWHLVFPCGDKLDLTGERRPVACFQHAEHAHEYGRGRWPSFYEVHQIGGRNGAYWLHPDGWFRLFPPTREGSAPAAPATWDDLSKAKFSLLCAESALGKARNAVVNAEVDVKVKQNQLAAIEKAKRADPA